MKKIKTILFPISLVYGFILKIRHWLYDKNILKSSSFNFPVICIGNLATGGTGKTPMTEYLVDMLKG
ncbi:MAG TPA: tetraacyldisaccharide 4'-kinase, partial [Ferruginibacter sp.]|nr:tetraacyldisaccharide 4'-kinase [Ferruginibacter sp.]